ncbi:rRNA small subunit 7-methylguanosine methyltransferase GidB [Aquipluma nitroreducens]|uniref:Ribosomal RNA small subunit methyltransferase G n=2 Tax=Aquipluma nitroreducens TaxID=2010828 RepID=A0A5K7S7A7_9BACT|nr:rRNA small subunit 7-methylguanosine methyltransferase GidB [Aquipluma nitroreducens]
MEILTKYFPDLTDQQMDQFGRLGALYEEWNAQINVISRKDIEQLYERHVLHSLAIAKVIQFNPQTTVLDVGTGGGFPGIPLAILFPETSFMLIDSIGKKIKVVNEVASALGLTNVTAEHIRVEEVKQKFDFVVSRAVTAFPRFVSMVQTKVASQSKNDLPNGILYLKGGDFDEEIEPFRKQIEVYELQSFFQEEFFETKRLIHMSIKNK